MLCLQKIFYSVRVIVLAIASLFLYSDLQAEESEAISHGPLYTESVPLPQKSNHRVLFGGGYDAANSMLNIYNLQSGYSYEFSDILEVGIVNKVFFPSATSLKKRMDAEFDLIGIEVEEHKPRWASYLVLSLIPIQGQINFFGSRIIPYAFLISAGPGLRQTRQGQELWGWYWAVHNRFYVKESLALELNFTQEQEAAFSKQPNVSRQQINLMAVFAF